MTKEECRNCRFYDPSQGYCRAHPPKRQKYATLSPAVLKHDWCGEFEPKKRGEEKSEGVTTAFLTKEVTLVN